MENVRPHRVFSIPVTYFSKKSVLLNRYEITSTGTKISISVFIPHKVDSDQTRKDGEADEAEQRVSKKMMINVEEGNLETQ